ncbi:hypothetical protein K227x_17460 [Rubripirellula lacrimiformis]|uniref:Uncharacterized protein n=1 Tax=Rubripirellula lacrimiformis TaxID=1930273 RepID=A0A517N896_9BACT|nr:hypothetical protein K227x_17460 [Rubripirellula lacrimiformis]
MLGADARIRPEHRPRTDGKARADAGRCPWTIDHRLGLLGIWNAIAGGGLIFPR